MLHIVHLLQRRFPNRQREIVTALTLMSGSVLLLGLGLLLLT